MSPVPSARPPAEVKKWARAWREMGYKIALWREDEEFSQAADLFLQSSQYPGYAQATNTLIRVAIEDFGAQWCVIGGDDVFPDTTKRADEVARECEAHFRGTFGVMQPTGDPYAGHSIERIAGSAWIGREFALRTYGGNGPLFHGYSHMFVDDELKCVAEKLGVYWQRRDLTHRHEHWMREGDLPIANRPAPPHLRRWITQQHWDESQTLFNIRKAAGFPGHEVAVEVNA